MMECRNFYLNSFDSVPSDISYLRVSTTGKLGSAQFEGNNPFDLRFDPRILRIRRNIWNAQAPKREATRLIACVDSLNFLEGDITTRLFSLERSVVAWAHLSMWIVSGISELIACANWVKELDCLVSTCRHNQLSLCHIANINDGGIVSHDSFVTRNVPRGSRLEKFDEISLQVPDQNLTLRSLLASRIVSSVGIFVTLLELVRRGNCRIRGRRE